MKARDIAGRYFITIAMLTVGMVSAQPYSSKPIRVVTSEAGGTNDFAVRLITPGLSGSLGQQVIVDNRGPGIIPSETVARAAPDGYTLLVHGSSIWLSSFLQDNVPYDPLRDFSPITLITSASNILVVHPSLPAKSVSELIRLAKAKPGELNYGATGGASAPRLAAELFKSLAGVDLVNVSYRAMSWVVNDLVAGRVQLMFPPAAIVTPYINAGRLRALAVTSAQPTALVPGMPTVAQSGLPGYEYSTVFAMLAPVKTPEPIIDRLNQQVSRELNKPDIKERLLKAGVEPMGGPPAQVTAKMKSDITQLGKMIKDLGLRAQ